MRQKITKLLVLLLIPLVYYVLISGFKEIAENKSCIGANSKAELKDFYSHIINSNYMELSVSLSPKDQSGIIDENSALGFLCSARRYTYEVINAGGKESSESPFVFKTCMGGVFTIDEGRTVLHAVPKVNQAGWLCRDISNIFEKRSENGSVIWKLKPVLKIPRGMEDDIRVIRIDIVPLGENKPVKSIEIKAGNFRDMTGNYNGGYTGEPINLPIGASLCLIGSVLAFTDSNENGNYKRIFDLRIWWYGESEVWFDKLVIEDQISEGLFKNTYDAKIKEETTPENFGLLINYLKYERAEYSNKEAVNYVMNVMYNKLQNQSLSISLK